MEHERVRDALLAGGLTGVLVSTLRATGDMAALRNRRAAVGGIAAALLVEWAFLRYPDRLLAWWERPAVNLGSALGLVGGTVLARRRPRLLAAGVWGLATYLALLRRLLLGRVRTESPAGRQQADR